MIDWRDQRRIGKVRVMMVSPANLEDVYGELEGVDLSGSSLSAGYYTDTRTNGKLSVVGDGWVRGSFLRISYEIPEWSYTRDLGTYLVIDDGAEHRNGIWHYTLELQSMLYALVTEKAKQPWTIAKNARIKNVMHQILDGAKRPYLDHEANDYVVSSPIVMESGKSLLERLYALASPSSNRIDVDGRGYVTLSPYIAPAKKVPLFELDLEDSRGVVKNGLTRTTDWLKMPTEAAVAYKYSETVNGKTVEKEIDAWATVSADNHSSRVIRGYTVTDFHTVSEMNPATQAEAQRLANLYLKGDSIEQVEWNLTSKYLPIWEGDVVDLIVHDGLDAYRGRRRCLVKSVDLDLRYMDMTLTLKETASGDEDG